MSIEYKDITQCEQLTELSDGAYFVVIENGDMKVISKAEAARGLVMTPVTEYNLIEEDDSTKLQKADGTSPAVQEVFNALKSGIVLLKADYNDISHDYYNVVEVNTQWEDGVVKWIRITYYGANSNMNTIDIGNMVVS